MRVKAAISAMALALAACNSGPDIQTTFDFQADFSRYRTFAFAGDPKAAGALVDPQVRNRLERLISKQLTARGYAPTTENGIADLTVRYVGNVGGRRDLGVELSDRSRGNPIWRTRIPNAPSAGYAEESWQKLDAALADAFSTLPPRR